MSHVALHFPSSSQKKEIPAYPTDPTTSNDVVKVANFPCPLADLSFSEELQKIAKIRTLATEVDNQSNSEPIDNYVQ